MSPIKIEHGCAREGARALVPLVCKVVDISEETSDVKAFRVSTPEGRRPFDSLPGQTAMLSVIPFGESMFCISAQGEDYLEFTVKRVGYVTEQLHALSVGATGGLRGPYGNWFPYEERRGKVVLVGGGGIGLAPLRSLLTYLLDHRADYGRIDLVYSGSTPDDLLFLDDIKNVWPQLPNVHTHVSIYKPCEGWEGEVCYTAPFLEDLKLSQDNRAVVLCGGPSLFRTCKEMLLGLGYAAQDIITTLEMKMKCGIGKCGRCNIGSLYICLDGPVFTLDELKDLPWSDH
jgi:NAD(P)H-flavin reductase